MTNQTLVRHAATKTLYPEILYLLAVPRTYLSLPIKNFVLLPN